MVHNGIRQARCEHMQHGGYSATFEVRVGDGGEPLPMIWQTGVSIRGGPDSSAVANTDFLTEYLFPMVFEFYNSISEILYQHDGLKRWQSAGPGVESLFIHSVTMRKLFPKSVIHK